MATRKVRSREYKITVQAAAFVGDEVAVLAACGRFWRAFSRALAEIGIGCTGDLDEVVKTREIRFFDTEEWLLRANAYVFRERAGYPEGKREVTLKFRHEDRYMSADRDMSAGAKWKDGIKFEDDLKSAADPKSLLRSLFSHSNTVKIRKDRKLGKLKAPRKLFPDLKDRLPDHDASDPLEIVGSFTARERVITGGTFDLDADGAGEAECAIIIWYDAAGDDETPVVAEFSFRYRAKKEAFTGEAARRAYDAFRALTKMPSGWIDREGPTKTGYVYSLWT